MNGYFYQTQSWRKEEEELNKSKNRKWKLYLKSDPKKLWTMLDWKGAIKHHDIGPSNIIYSYFSKICNSMKICNNPTIEVIKRNLETYDVYNDLTENTIDLSVLECALHNMGKGSSFDGLASKGLLYSPQNLKECILLLFQKMFGRVYPSQWQKQLLSPIPQKGHVINDPKLRGT